MLEFTQTSTYEQWWSSEGEGSNQSVSLWKPGNPGNPGNPGVVPSSGYYLLGDTITESTGLPLRSALLVKSAR